MINITPANKKDCCGCTACASVCPKNCITMVSDSEGFSYPAVEKDLCINCNLCEQVCPVINHNINNEEMPLSSLIVRNKDAETVQTSSSGGAVTAFCKEIIKDNGIVFGCAFNENFDVIHKSAETLEEILAFKGSKYVQSNLGNTYKAIKQQLENGRKVLFIGTPCQADGLNIFLKKPYENLYTVDFVCHGVPSPLVWEKYKDIMTKKYKSKITYANFREKTYGYHSANLALKYANGKKSAENTKTDYLMKSFFDDICSRPSCYDCKFKTAKRNSDITVFDCWNISRYVPNLSDDDKGLTAVFVQNEKGQQLLNSVKDDFICYPANTETLLKTDGYMAVKSVSPHPKRTQYFKMLNDGVSLDKVVATLIPIKTSRKIFGKTKGFLYKTGMLKLVKKLKK